MTRKLASIQKIENLLPIEGADRIELALVLGWQVVVQKGIHKVGDNVVFYEIDSFLPASDARYDSFKERFIEWNGKTGMRLKTIKLRKQLSQGLIMPLELFSSEFCNEGASFYKIGEDVTEVLGIEKWEAPENAFNGSRVDGKGFPVFIRKTDQERIQNCGRTVEDMLDDVFEVTLKMDGSSLTVFRLLPNSKYYESFAAANGVAEGEVAYGICSRNLLLKLEGETNFHVGAKPIMEALKLVPMEYGSIAIQAELLAPTIQNNYEKVSGVEAHIFDIFDIEKQVFVSFARRSLISDVHLSGVKHVRKLEFNKLKYILNIEEGTNLVNAVLDYADGEGYNKGVKREGVVFKHCNGSFSFKAISNSYLLATGK